MKYITELLDYLDVAQQHVKTTSIGIIGDFMVDRWVYGNITRLSPEAPVPILHQTHINEFLGGAGNVLTTLLKNACICNIVGLIGNDDAGKRIRSHLMDSIINLNRLITLPEYITVVKTRFIQNNTHVFRSDAELIIDPKNFPRWMDRHLDYIIETINEVILASDKIIIQDYEKGMILNEIVTDIISNIQTKKVFVDPKFINTNDFKNIELMKLNENEAKSYLQTHSSPSVIFKKQEENNIKNIVITRGNLGLSHYENERETVCKPIFTQLCVDPTGAGDIAIAWLTMLHDIDTIPLIPRLDLVNVACGLKITKMGTTPIGIKDVVKFLENQL